MKIASADVRQAIEFQRAYPTIRHSVAGPPEEWTGWIVRLCTSFRYGLALASIRVVMNTMNSLARFWEGILLVLLHISGTIMFVTAELYLASRANLAPAEGSLMWSGIIVSAVNIVFAPFLLYIPPPLQKMGVDKTSGVIAQQLTANKQQFYEHLVQIIQTHSMDSKSTRESQSLGHQSSSFTSPVHSESARASAARLRRQYVARSRPPRSET